MRGNSGIQTTITSTQHSPTQPTNSALTNTLLGSLTIAFPAVIICAIVGYRKYRTTALRRRIQCLNRLWKIDSSKKLP